MIKHKRLNILVTIASVLISKGAFALNPVPDCPGPGCPSPIIVHGIAQYPDDYIYGWYNDNCFAHGPTHVNQALCASIGNHLTQRQFDYLIKNNFPVTYSDQGHDDFCKHFFDKANFKYGLSRFPHKQADKLMLEDQREYRQLCGQKNYSAVGYSTVVDNIWPLSTPHSDARHLRQILGQ